MIQRSFEEMQQSTGKRVRFFLIFSRGSDFRSGRRQQSEDARFPWAEER